MQNFLISITAAVVLAAGILAAIYGFAPKDQPAKIVATEAVKEPPRPPLPTRPKIKPPPPTQTATKPAPEPSPTFDEAAAWTAREVLPEYQRKSLLETRDKNRLFSVLTIEEKLQMDLWLRSGFEIVPVSGKMSLYQAGFRDTVRARATESAIDDKVCRQLAAEVWGRLPEERKTREYAADLIYRWGMLSRVEQIYVQTYFATRLFSRPEQRDAVLYWVGEDSVITGGRPAPTP